MIPIARPEIGEDEIAAVTEVLRSGKLAQGHEVAAFENEFSNLVSPGYEGIAVNSGTSALHLALLALGIGPGDEVIVPSFTFAATANAVAMAGATPVFADIQRDTFCIDVSSANSLLTPRTAAIIPVHLYGCPADLPALRNLVDRAGLAMIEDASQAHLAALHGQKVGTWADAGAFSFYPTKNMTTGEGGMVSVRDESVARRVRLLRNQGQEVRYRNEIAGLNNRMTEIQAAIGRVQLTRLVDRTDRRQAIARRYSDELVGVVVPTIPEGASHVFHQYTILLQGLNRDEFRDALARSGVGSDIYYPVPVHSLPAYDRDEHLPRTIEASASCLSIPVRPNLDDASVDRVIEAVNAAVDLAVRAQ